MRFQQLKHDPNSVMRKKLVKSKKNWVVVSSLSIAGGLLLLGAPTTVSVKADVAPINVQTVLTESNNSSTEGMVTGKAEFDTPSGKVYVDIPATKVGETVTVKVPIINGYKASVDTITGKLDVNGKFTPDSDVPVTYIAVNTGSNSGTNDNTLKNTTKSLTASSDATANTVNTADNSTTVPVEDSNTENAAPTEAPVSPTVQKDKVPDESATDASDKNILATTSKTELEKPMAAIAEVATLDTTPAKSGTTNGIDWTLDDSDVLHLNAGTMTDNTLTTSPWADNAANIMTISVDGAITAPVNMQYMFANLPNLTGFNNLNNIDTNSTTNMNGLFTNETSVNNIDLSQWKLGNVKSLSKMFQGDSVLSEVKTPDKLSSFSNANDYSYALADCPNLIDVSNIGNWQPAQPLTNFISMFRGDGLLGSSATEKSPFSLMWGIDGTSNTGDSSKGEGMFDGTNFTFLRLSNRARFNTTTALTSNNGSKWVGTGNDSSKEFSGVPTATSGLGYTYNGTLTSSNYTSITYQAQKSTGNVQNIITIHSNLGDKTTIISGNVGDSVSVTVPTVEDYTPDLTKVTATIGQTQAVADQTVTYVGKTITSSELPSNLGGQVVKLPTDSKVGDTVTVDVPKVSGYNDPNPASVDVVVQPDGSLKLVDGKDFTYVGKTITSSKLPSNLGNQDVKLPTDSKVGDTVTVDVPKVSGYTPNQKSVTGIVQPDGSLKIVNPINYREISTGGNNINIENQKGTISTYIDQPDVQIYTKNADNTMSLIGNHKLGNGTDWLTDQILTNNNNDTYYRVATNEWVKASQVYPYKSVNKNMKTYGSFDKTLYNAEGNIISGKVLSKNTYFTTDRIAYINSNDFYRVTPNEFVKATNAFEANGTNSGDTNNSDNIISERNTISTFSDQPDVQLFSQTSDNKITNIGNRKLAHNTDWLTDQKVIIDGESYYRVATNEYVKASQVYPYKYGLVNVRTTNTSSKRLYTAEGNLIANRQLAANSNWRTDRTTYINGIEYYRVATNEFVRADDVYVY